MPLCRYKQLSLFRSFYACSTPLSFVTNSLWYTYSTYHQLVVWHFNKTAAAAAVNKSIYNQDSSIEVFSPCWFASGCRRFVSLVYWMYKQVAICTAQKPVFPIYILFFKGEMGIFLRHLLHSTGQDWFSQCMYKRCIGIKKMGPDCLFSSLVIFTAERGETIRRKWRVAAQRTTTTTATGFWHFRGFDSCCCFLTFLL